MVRGPAEIAGDQPTAVSLHQINLGFDGLRKIGISIEGEYAVPASEGTAIRYLAAPEGATALVALLGSKVADVQVTEPGTTTVGFAEGASRLATLTVVKYVRQFEGSPFTRVGRVGGKPRDREFDQVLSHGSR